MTHLEGDGTLLSGPLPAGLLEGIRDLNLTLVPVNCGIPSTQEADKNN